MGKIYRYSPFSARNVTVDDISWAYQRHVCHHIVQKKKQIDIDGYLQAPEKKSVWSIQWIDLNFIAVVWHYL